MTENKKPRYPSDRLKLHALKDRLEQEIAQRQQKLVEVTRLVRQADNSAIVKTALNYDVTPDEFDRLVQALRSGSIPQELLKAASAQETSDAQEVSAEEDAPVPDEPQKPERDVFAAFADADEHEDMEGYTDDL